MRSRSQTAGTLALALATIALFGTVVGTAWFDRGGSTTVKAVVRTDANAMATDVVEGPLAAPLRTELAVGESSGAPARVETAEATGGLRATLVLTDARTGLPVRRAWLQRSEFGALDRRGERFELDDAAGRIDLVLEEERASVIVSAAQYIAKEIHIDRPGIHAVILERATSIVGTVRDGQSAPVASARVRLEFLGSTLTGLMEHVEPIPIKGPTLRRTDDEGRFAFTKLAPGVYRTVATVDGAEHASRARQIHAGEWVDIDHWLDEATRLEVRVDRPDGVPAARARVLLAPQAPEGPTLTRYTDEEGRAVLGPLDPGTYDVSVQSADGVMAPLSLTIDDDGRALVDLHLQLERGTTPRD